MYLPADALAPSPDIDTLQALLHHWILMAQALVASVGALAFVLAFLWKMVAVEPRSVMESKRWIGRIVFGTLGVEMATQLANLITSSTPR
jgi:hypothetical protein